MVHQIWKEVVRIYFKIVTILTFSVGTKILKTAAQSAEVCNAEID
jgi:hypothetical protein